MELRPKFSSVAFVLAHVLLVFATLTVLLAVAGRILAALGGLLSAASSSYLTIFFLAACCSALALSDAFNLDTVTAKSRAAKGRAAKLFTASVRAFLAMMRFSKDLAEPPVRHARRMSRRASNLIERHTVCLLYTSPSPRD